ncbi:acyl-CoA N-acyltransferase [Lentinus tigrinus ALCF2SS1-6]|uniref:Acyl-CoA N-acyltransferase n=1 Tax=Lentinus tigrinus ALCF2SS1-6 TaxID=1328759 RepID=A0A5C2S8G4_9APHY|nr:acyl-CoA N-acyltransferase [Lentinus tigrinus ALCF2SS1-6]
MSVTVRQVTDPSEAEIDAYTKLLAEAFSYRFFAFALGGDKDLQEPMHRAHITAALANNGGEVHIAELPDEGVVGVAVWFPPGSKFLSTEAQREAGWNQLMAKLELELRDWWTQFLDEYDDMVERALGPDVKLGAYHLQLIGVHPQRRRKGIARALMQFAESKAHAVGVASVLETGSSSRVYEGLGYTVAGSGPIHLLPKDKTFEMSAYIKHTESN